MFDILIVSKMLRKEQKSKIIKASDDASYWPICWNKLISACNVSKRVDFSLTRRYKESDEYIETGKVRLAIFCLKSQSPGRYSS